MCDVCVCADDVDWFRPKVDSQLGPVPIGESVVRVGCHLARDILLGPAILISGRKPLQGKVVCSRLFLLKGKVVCLG